MKLVQESRVQQADQVVHDCCPKCGDNRSKLHLRLIGSEYSVVRCDACQLMRTHPFPPESLVRKSYSTNYRPHQPRPAEHEPAGRTARRHRVSFKRTYLPPTFGGGRLLEIGCGVGGYLKEMQAIGWNAFGVEKSLLARESADEAIRERILVADFPSENPHRGPFDLIAAWQVIEHLDEPASALVAMRKLLTPQGLLIASVPNASSWTARMFSNDWIGWDAPRHLLHFTPASFVELIRECGFRIEQFASQPRSSWVRHSAKNVRGWRRVLRWNVTSRAFASMARCFGSGDSLFVMAQPTG